MKKIVINLDKCTGCGTCELVCSLHHFGVNNPRKSRIKVIRDYEKGNFYPIIAGPIADEECAFKSPMIIRNQEYDQCLLCRAICPSREFFKDPGTGEPLKCDLCIKCVRFCNSGALSFVS